MENNNNTQQEPSQELCDAVEASLVADMLVGDTTVLAELLKHLPKKILIESLPEDRWKEFE